MMNNHLADHFPIVAAECPAPPLYFEHICRIFQKSHGNLPFAFPLCMEMGWFMIV